MPAFSHGRNAKLYVDDAAATACTLVSGDITSIVLTWTRDNPQVTTLGLDSHQRISGLRDAVITGAYVWNGAEVAASGFPQVLDALLTASMVTLVRYAPAGSITGCPLYTACMLVNSHSHTAGVNAPVVGTFALQLASGSLTSGSCV